MTRERILDVAKEIVCVDQYGKSENNFKLIANLWNAYLNSEAVTDKDVAVMMILLKIARIATGANKSDNWVDIAGYAACGGDLDQ